METAFPEVELGVTELVNSMIDEVLGQVTYQTDTKHGRIDEKSSDRNCNKSDNELPNEPVIEFKEKCAKLKSQSQSVIESLPVRIETVASSAGECCPEHQKQLFTKALNLLCIKSVSNSSSNSQDISQSHKNEEFDTLTPTTFKEPDTVHFNSPIAVVYEYCVSKSPSMASTQSLSDDDSEGTECKDDKYEKNKTLQLQCNVENSSQVNHSENKTAHIVDVNGVTYDSVCVLSAEPVDDESKDICVNIMTPAGDSYNTYITNYNQVKADSSTQEEKSVICNYEPVITANTAKIHVKDLSVYNSQTVENNKELDMEKYDVPVLKSDHKEVYSPERKIIIPVVPVAELFQKAQVCPSFDASPDLFLETENSESLNEIQTVLFETAKETDALMKNQNAKIPHPVMKTLYENMTVEEADTKDTPNTASIEQTVKNLTCDTSQSLIHSLTIQTCKKSDDCVEVSSTDMDLGDSIEIQLQGANIEVPIIPKKRKLFHARQEVEQPITKMLRYDTSVKDEASLVKQPSKLMFLAAKTLDTEEDDVLWSKLKSEKESYMSQSIQRSNTKTPYKTNMEIQDFENIQTTQVDDKITQQSNTEPFHEGISACTENISWNEKSDFCAQEEKSIICDHEPIITPDTAKIHMNDLSVYKGQTVENYQVLDMEKHDVPFLKSDHKDIYSPERKRISPVVHVAELFQKAQVCPSFDASPDLFLETENSESLNEIQTVLFDTTKYADVMKNIGAQIPHPVIQTPNENMTAEETDTNDTPNKACIEQTVKLLTGDASQSLIHSLNIQMCKNSDDGEEVPPTDMDLEDGIEHPLKEADLEVPIIPKKRKLFHARQEVEQPIAKMLRYDTSVKDETSLVKQPSKLMYLAAKTLDTEDDVLWSKLKSEKETDMSQSIQRSKTETLNKTNMEFQDFKNIQTTQVDDKITQQSNAEHFHEGISACTENISLNESHLNDMKVKAEISEETISNVYADTEISEETVTHVDTDTEISEKTVTNMDTYTEISEETVTNVDTATEISEETVTNVDTDTEKSDETVTNVDTDTEISEEKVTHVDTDTEISGEKVTHVDTDTEISGEKVTNVNTDTEISEEKVTHVDTDTEISGEKVTHVDTDTEISGEKVTHVDTDTEISGEKVTNVDTDTEISGEKVTNVDTATEISGEKITNVDKDIEVSEEKVTNVDTDIEVTEEKVTNVDTNTKVQEETVTNVDTDTEIREETVTNMDTYIEVTEEKVTNVDIDTKFSEETVTHGDTNTKVQEETVTNVDTDTEIREETVTNVDTDIEVTEEKVNNVDIDTKFREETVTNGDTNTEVLEETVTNVDADTEVSEETVTNVGIYTKVREETVTYVDTDTEVPECADNGNCNAKQHESIEYPGFISATEHLSQSSQGSSTEFIHGQDAEGYAHSQTSDKSINYVNNSIVTDNQGCCIAASCFEAAESMAPSYSNTSDVDKRDGKAEPHEIELDIDALGRYIDKSIDQIVPGANAMHASKDALNPYVASTEAKLYSCDADICDETDIPLCKTVEKRGDGDAPKAGCFKWRYAPSCDIDNQPEPPESLDLEDQVVRIVPLKSCGKPIRLGLSKKQSLVHLHKFKQHKPM